MRLILVRHGETPENRRGEIQGQRDTQLSTIGQQQARDIAENLRDAHFRAVFTSDLQRARDTTYEILRYHQGVECHTRWELRERSLGVFESCVVPDFENAVRNQALKYYEYQPPGGESLLDVEARVGRLWQSIWREFSDQTVVISAHNGPNIALLKFLLGYSFEEAKSIQQDNGCINIVDLSPEAAVVECGLNLTDHLETKTDNRMDGLSR